MPPPHLHLRLAREEHQHRGGMMQPCRDDRIDALHVAHRTRTIEHGFLSRALPSALKYRAVRLPFSQPIPSFTLSNTLSTARRPCRARSPSCFATSLSTTPMPSTNETITG